MGEICLSYGDGGAPSTIFIPHLTEIHLEIYIFNYCHQTNQKTLTKNLPQARHCARPFIFCSQQFQRDLLDFAQTNKISQNCDEVDVEEKIRWIF